MQVGELIPYGTLAQFKSDGRMIAYLRKLTYQLKTAE